MKKTAAIILAAGNGSRMKSDIPKQFMKLGGKSLFLYSVELFDSICQKVIVVTSKADVGYCRRELETVKLLHPVIVTEGGAERYLSSIEGLKQAADCEFVMIHDAARACINREIALQTLESAMRCGSGVASVPVKDTIKIVDDKNQVVQTPDRSQLRAVQTPQTFAYQLIWEAYERLQKKGDSIIVTDDAMVMEQFGSRTVMLTEGSYENIKITTPEDLLIAEKILESRDCKS